MATPIIHLSFIGPEQVVVTVGARTYTMAELKALGLVSLVHSMFLARMGEQLHALVDKLPAEAS